MRSCPIVTAIYIHTAEGNVAVLLRWRGSLCAKFTDEDGLILTIVSPWRNGFDTWTLMPVLNLQGGNQWTSSNCALCKWMNQWEMCVKNHQLDITWCNDETVFLFYFYIILNSGLAQHITSWVRRIFLILFQDWSFQVPDSSQPRVNTHGSQDYTEIHRV